MLDRYTKRLQRDLDRWIEAGLVPAQNRQAILNDVAPEPGRWSAQGAAAILGAVLLALAALSFVAANWSELSRVVRFALILGALWASYGGAAFAFARKNAAVGHALALLGAALFGGAIALTAQTFNLSAFRNTGILIWAVGALSTALVIPSRPVLIASSLIGGFWLLSEAQNPLAPAVLWAYPLLFAVSAAAASRLQSNVAMNLSAIGLGWWLMHTLHEVHQLYELESVAAMVCFALICGALALGAALLRDRGVPGAGVIAAWGAAGAAAGVFAAQFTLDDYARPESVLAYSVIAAPTLLIIAGLLIAQVRAGHLGRTSSLALGGAGAISFALPYGVYLASDSTLAALQFLVGGAIFAAGVILILMGSAPGRRAAGAIGVVLFTAQAIYVYAELFGGLLGTAAFFFVGGVLMIVLSVVLTRIARRLGKGEAS
jgi:uncharacterized membrane protein